MIPGNTFTVIGNLVDDPSLNFTSGGHAVAKLRVASTPRFQDKNTKEWKDGETLFLDVNVWRQTAENCAESLQRGMRVIVHGRLKQRSYETKDGEKRIVYEIEADEVGPSLRSATAKVMKAGRHQAQSGVSSNDDVPPPPEPPADDLWRTPVGAGTGGYPGFSGQPPF